jgi:hypothetical protein
MSLLHAQDQWFARICDQRSVCYRDAVLMMSGESPDQPAAVTGLRQWVPTTAQMRRRNDSQSRETLFRESGSRKHGSTRTEAAVAATPVRVLHDPAEIGPEHPRRCSRTAAVTLRRTIWSRPSSTTGGRTSRVRAYCRGSRSDGSRNRLRRALPQPIPMRARHSDQAGEACLARCAGARLPTRQGRPVRRAQARSLSTRRKQAAQIDDRMAGKADARNAAAAAHP